MCKGTRGQTIKLYQNIRLDPLVTREMLLMLFLLMFIYPFLFIVFCSLLFYMTFILSLPSIFILFSYSMFLIFVCHFLICDFFFWCCPILKLLMTLMSLLKSTVANVYDVIFVNLPLFYILFHFYFLFLSFWSFFIRVLTLLL